MKYNYKELLNYSFITKDGIEAKIIDMMFDAQSWSIKHILIQFKGDPRQLLLPISNMKIIILTSEKLLLTDIMHSTLVSQKSITVSRRLEDFFVKYLNKTFSSIREPDIALTSDLIESDYTLLDYKSCNVITRSEIYAKEGVLAKIQDVILDNNWKISYLALSHYRIPFKQKGLLNIYLIKSLKYNNHIIETNVPLEVIWKLLLFRTDADLNLMKNKNKIHHPEKMIKHI